MKWYAIRRWFRKRSKKKTRYRKNKPATFSPLWRQRLKWSIRVLFLLLAIDIFYLSTIWPDWDAIKQGRLPKSQFILAYEHKRLGNPGLPKLRWRVVPYGKLPRSLKRSVVVAEDGRFYTHRGFDMEALIEAFERSVDRGHITHGASTISQQTVKNMFLSPSRNPLRKWHELVLTLGMEFKLSKRQILWLYLNIAEFGQGVYGADAAARHYWGIPATQLTERQAIELAATLPSPIKHNPKTRTTRFLRRASKITRYYNLRYY